MSKKHQTRMLSIPFGDCISNIMLNLETLLERLNFKKDPFNFIFGTFLGKRYKNKNRFILYDFYDTFNMRNDIKYKKEKEINET